MNILLCTTGSVAATVTDKTVLALQELGEVRIAATDAGAYFMQASALDISDIILYEDDTEWREWELQKNVLHIDLVKWADVLVIAPLSANTLAKFWAGLCDNLVTCIFRAWPCTLRNKIHPNIIEEIRKPIVIAPAMNTEMWNDSITGQHIAGIAFRKNVVLVDPIVKTLACGDHGVGAMADVNDIVKSVKKVTKQWMR